MARSSMLPGQTTLSLSGHHFSFRVLSHVAVLLLLAYSLLFTGQAAETNITPAAWLAAQPKPKFKPGHHLPPLTRFGWTLPFDARVELAQHWGYVLEFGGYARLNEVQKRLGDTNSVESRLCALAASDPNQFALGIILDRNFPQPMPDDFWIRDEQGRFTDGKNVWQDPANSKFGKLASPEAPDANWEKIAEAWAVPLRLIRERAPIAIVLNGGEYAMGVAAAQAERWDKDPRVREARGNRSWFEYSSQRKARQESIVAKAVREALPDRQLYIYYNTSSESHRSEYKGWDGWAYDSAFLRNASDLPSNESYYRHFNSGWTGSRDALTLFLNSVGYHLSYGAPLSYNWLCAGWDRKGGAKDFSELDRYTGFIKCLYIAGMVGGNAGYYAYPKGGFGVAFPANEPPHWLQQMTALAYVHAFFSHYEDYLRDGWLLPGPLRHKWSKDQPAYEFPTGDAEARVLARKRRELDEWLIVAWAAGGPEREVKVDIPRLGQLFLRARASGAIYHARLADGKPVVTVLDESK